MKTYRMTILCLLASLCVAVNAQEKVEYQATAQWTIAQGPVIWQSVGKPIKTADGKTLVAWPTTENIYSKDTTTYWANTVHISGDYVKEAFPQMAWEMDDDMSCTSWRLNEDGKRTILTCYLKMPADAVKGLWLGDEETYIVDQETGIRYCPRNPNPEWWGKHFGVRAPAGSVVEFSIDFPPLPSSVEKIAIYGVPAWGMRGWAVTLERVIKTDEYDTIPRLRVPRMVKPEGKNYNKSDGNTWAVYTDMHLVKPFPKERTMALWRTPETTYLAMAVEQNWTREYFGYGSDIFLLDNAGRRYKIKKIQGLPFDHIFWNEGVAGDWHAIVMEFEPLPLSVSTITYVSPESEPFDSWGANWDGMTISGLSIDQLHLNQSLFQYAERVFVK